jgi:hypothetical protein
MKLLVDLKVLETISYLEQTLDNSYYRPVDLPSNETISRYHLQFIPAVHFTRSTNIGVFMYMFISISNDTMLITN